MGNFKNFLNEVEDDQDGYISDEDALQLIKDELADMNEDEIYAFAYVLYYEFFEEEENPEDNYEDFTIDDVWEMINTLGPESYADILDLLLPDETQDDFDWDSINLGDEEDDLEEGVSRVMRRKNFNRKKRKFFKKTKADLRKNIAKRRKANRLNRAKRKRYYRANKVKIQSYRKSRSAAVKRGRHITKVRRGA